MKDPQVSGAARLENESVRIVFTRSGDGVSYAIEFREGGDWRSIHGEPFPMRFLALRAGSASPITLRPAWEPGKPETNFAAFHTEASDGGHDVFAAGERYDLAPVEIEQVDASQVRCWTADGTFEVTWSLGHSGGVEVAYTFLPPEAGYWSVGFAAYGGLDPDEVNAILAGPFLTERRFPAVAGVLPEGYLSAPFALVETGESGSPVTWALGVHPDIDAWEWRDISEARYAIGALNEVGEIQPLVFAPVLGNPDSWRNAGEPITFRVVLHPRAGAWWDAWRSMARDVYGLRSYRENMYGSLTDAVHNMIDLIKDDVYSGWMERGRGLLNIEHRGGVKLASPAAVLSAGLVTADRELLETRAQPILEYSLSRSHYGFTWEIDSKTVGQEHVRQAFEDLGGPAWDAPVLVALHQLSLGHTPALGQLAESLGDGIDDFYIRRSDFQVSLSLYHLTGEQAHLDRAKSQADAHIRQRIDTPATDPVEGQRFLIHIGSDWMSLLDLWEATSEPRYLDAAERGARWFAALLWLGPVPGEDAAAQLQATAPTEKVVQRATAFERHMFDDHTGASSWVRDSVPYPRGLDQVPQEMVPTWATSAVGMSFEAWCTYRGRMVQNPGWAAYLLRLAQATGDDLYRDLAANSIVGRFTNYPGYYYYVPTDASAKPDFPYLGPMDLTSIYYHHIPPQIGLTLDYLVEEMRDHSGGRIVFPIVRNDSFVQFRHHLPGHAPGVFWDLADAWLWIPRDLATLDTHLVNWIAVASTAGDRFGLALSNSAARPVTTTVQLDRGLLGLSDTDSPSMVILDASGDEIETGAFTADRVTVTILPRSLVSVLLDGVRIDEPLHSTEPAAPPAQPAWLTVAEDDPHLGTIRAGVVGISLEHLRAYAFTTLKPDRAATFSMAWQSGNEWRDVMCDRFPFEVSVPIAESPFQFRVTVVDHDGKSHESPIAELVGPSPGSSVEGSNA